MDRRLFGTDGIRGEVNKHPMTAYMVQRIGEALGKYFGAQKGKSKRVVIGKDTRESGYMFEYALTAGLTSAGMDALLLGPVPTPAVGLLTSSMRADLGIMISASHNKFHDNGIKFFGPDGFKLSDKVEMEIEELLDNAGPTTSVAEIGRAQRVDDGRFRYVERAKSTFPNEMRLDGIKVVIDCANGAAYRAAPEVLWELGADVISVGVNPDGQNINEKCGSTDPKLAVETVLEQSADVGLCLDGDADRLILIDEKGQIGDGDQLMGLLAERWSKANKLKRCTLVATEMSNLGLELHLKEKGITLERTQVGDRYVVERMREGGFNLGGEQSGHIVMTDYATTGDGLIAGLQFLAEILQTGKPASENLNLFTPVPQLLKNVHYLVGQQPMQLPEVQKTVLSAEDLLRGRGRLLIRKSGTEPLIRVMAECEDDSILKKAVDDIVDALEKACFK